ncbi:MAG: hypothetical protein WBQ10_18215 [Terriglobales bacterium]
MEGLAHLVAESLVRHGVEPSFDHRRLQWSNWFRCQDSFSLVLAPCKPGLFALGEEVATFCGASEPRSRHPERSEGSPSEGKRMLALFQISEADDVGMALGRLFLSGSPARERFASGRCFARYVVIEDANQRRTALTALQRWMASSSEAASGLPQAASDDNHVAQNNDALRDAHVASDAPVRGAERSSAGSTSAHGSEGTRFVSGHDFSRAANPTTSTAALAADASPQPESSNEQAQIGPPLPIPSGF